MEFYVKNDKGIKVAILEYHEGTNECSDCNSITIKPGSLMSKTTICLDRWYNCKWIDDARDKAVKMNIVKDFNDQYYVFIKELSCESPIKAVSVILGHIESNAWELMFNKDGKTLKELYR